VAAAVLSHKHHLTIHVGAGPIQLANGSPLRILVRNGNDPSHISIFVHLLEEFPVKAVTTVIQFWCSFWYVKIMVAHRQPLRSAAL